MKLKVNNLFLLISISFLVIVGFSGCPSQSQVYKLSFNTDGGSTISSQLVIENKTATMPINPTKEGYIFGGWYTEVNGEGTEFTANTKVIGDITVYAKWNSYSYTVTFDNQDTTTASDPTSKTVISPNTTVDVLPTAPEKIGYTFGGWYTEVNGEGSEFTSNTKVIGDITVYAKWNYSYEVTFDSQEATTPSDPTSKTVISPNTTVDVLPTAPEKIGYTFGGWYTEVNGEGTEFTANTKVIGDITVYAKWNSYSYTVTFDNQDTTTASDPTSKTVISPNTTVDVLPTAPEKIGYTFGGWYTEVNGGGSEFTSNTKVIGDITVYAKWNSYSYTVTFDSQEATTPSDPTSKTVISPNTTVDGLPTVPEKTGYIFGGWYTEENGGGIEFIESTIVTEDITVYAKWGDEFIIPNSNGVKINFKKVPAGKFTMGSPSSESGRDNDEGPRHEVTLTNDYMMGTYEVTQEQWEAVMGNNPSYHKGDKLPVEKVSWYDAVEFCNKLSELVGRDPVYNINGTSTTCDFTKNGFRLPTEAEWEYAARGGGLDNYKVYSGSNNLSEVGWYGSNSFEKTHTIGQKEPNKLGIYDMSGNVFEWCWDWYDSSYYSVSPDTEPIGPSSGSLCVIRGGSWYGDSKYCRSADRGGGSPSGSSYINIGFRLVYSL